MKSDKRCGLSSRPFLDARAVEAVVDAAERLLFFLVVEQDVPVDAAKSIPPDEAFAIGPTNETRLEPRFRFCTRGSVLRKDFVVIKSMGKFNIGKKFISGFAVFNN